MGNHLCSGIFVFLNKKEKEVVKMKILVACEESQAVTTAMRNLGHEAYSCDIQPCFGNHPKWHLQQDVIPLLEMKWDMIIAHPARICLMQGQDFYFPEEN